jgi:hypothetical protein
VVLDNLEQMLGCAPELAELVALCPELFLLVTSRAPLRVRAEYAVKLAPLIVLTGVMHVQPGQDEPEVFAHHPSAGQIAGVHPFK